MNWATRLLRCAVSVLCLTADARTVIPLDWHVRRDVATAWEIELDLAKFRAGGLAVRKEEYRGKKICRRGFAVKATMADGSDRTVPVSVLDDGRDARICGDNLILRFLPPNGTAKLDLVQGAVDRQPIVDSALCENLFADALRPQSVGDWTVTNGGTVEASHSGVLLTATRIGKEAWATYAIPVSGDHAGRPCRFEMDVKSLSDMTWTGMIVVRQIAEDGKELPELMVDPRWTCHLRPPGKLTPYRENGYIHRKARKLVVAIQMRYITSLADNHGLSLDRPDRLQPKLLVSRLAVRPAAELPFPGYENRHFAKGVTDEPSDSSICLGGDRVFCYQTRSLASWAQNVKMRRDDQIFFPRLAGTVEAWFRPDWKESDGATYTLLEASHSTARNEKTPYYVSRGALLEVVHCPRTGRIRLAMKDFADRIFDVEGKSRIPVGVWTHVACTFEPEGKAVLWIGGRKTLEMPLAGFCPFELETSKYPNDAGPLEVWLGGGYRSGRNGNVTNPKYPFLPGCADLLRVSTVVRYTGDFEPMREFKLDEKTCALFNFDRDYDGVSAHGPGWISGSYLSMTGRLARMMEVDGREVRYFPERPTEAVDFGRILDNHPYKQIPSTVEADMARSRQRKSWTLKAGGKAVLNCPDDVVTDYIEYRNVGGTPLLHPMLINRGEIDPRSFGDISDTLLADCRTDRARADRIFNFLLQASNYSQNHHPFFPPGSDVPRTVEYEALLMLNCYCGFECGPLNNLSANLFACSGLCPSAQTGGYGHAFQEVFFEGKNRIYDLSARQFFPAMDNETIADLDDADREFGVMRRVGAKVVAFCRCGNRYFGVRDPAYQKKCGIVLNPGEKFRMWRRNNGICNDLQLNSCFPGNVRKLNRKLCFYKTDISCDCRATCRTDTGFGGVRGDDLSRIDRFFPEYCNGFLVFDGKPIDGNPAFTNVTADSFCYQVKSCYPIVHAEYGAKVSGKSAGIELSTDRGRTWCELPLGADGCASVDYPVRARHEYLIRVRAPISRVSRFWAKTEIQANRRVLPGVLHGGANSLTFRADSDASAEVTVGYRVNVKPIEVKGALFTGAIVGCERLFALVNPTRRSEFSVVGASQAATVRTYGGLKAELRNGKLTVTAGKGEVPRFGAVDIVDGNAEKRMTVLVAENARLASAENAGLSGGARLLERDETHANVCAELPKAGAKVRFGFEPLPAGRYVVLELTRYRSALHPAGGKPAVDFNGDIALMLPGQGKPVPSGAQESLPDGYWKTPMGLGRPGERGNFKWEYPVDPDSYYPYQMMRGFDLADGADYAEVSCPATFPDGIEVAAIIVLPEPERDFKAYLRKVLCGYNCEPWSVIAE